MLLICASEVQKHRRISKNLATRKTQMLVTAETTPPWTLTSSDHRQVWRQRPQIPLVEGLPATSSAEKENKRPPAPVTASSSNGRGRPSKTLRFVPSAQNSRQNSADPDKAEQRKMTAGKSSKKKHIKPKTEMISSRPASAGKIAFLLKMSPQWCCYSLLLAFAICCSYLPYGNLQRTECPTRDSALDISHAITNLAHDLALELRSRDSKSEIISPLSIGSSMLLLLRAARGETRQELLRLLHLDRYQLNDCKIPRSFSKLLDELVGAHSNGPSRSGYLEDPPRWWNQSKCILPEYEEDYYDDYDDGLGPQAQEPNIIRLANAIFVQKGSYDNKRFEYVVNTLYKSTVENVDFSGEPDITKQHINSWAREHTNGRISEIISDHLSPETMMVVANALYFKAKWEEVFMAHGTKVREFFPDGEDGKPIEAEIMSHGGCFPFYASQSLDARILGFPYKNRTTTMYVVLPNNSNRVKLQQLLEKLDAATFDNLVANMTMRTATVLFPKLHITSSFDLKTVFQKLGVDTMFRQGRSNLSLLKPAAPWSTSPSVSGILHKVFLDVNESGTEGGAVTATLLDRSMPAINFRALTPFLIAIRHDATKLLLFYGPVYDPTG